MAKGIYLGIDSLSRKVKKMYLGIEGVARKVKKGYVGVNGLARLFFSGAGKPVYDGLQSVSTTSTFRRSEAAIASTKHHWILSGGRNGSTNIPGATAYDTDFTESSTGPSVNRVLQCSANFAGEAVFACGDERTSFRQDAYSYNDDLTYTQIYPRNISSRGVSGATSQSHLVLAGSGLSGYGSYVNIFDEAFTVTVPDYLSKPSGYMSGASLGSKALFYGGEEPSYIEAVRMAYIFDDDGTRQDIDGLPQNSYGVAAVSLGNEVVLAGGGLPNSNACVDDSYVMNVDLTRTSIGNLATPRMCAAGLELDGTAVIISGITYSGSLRSAEYFDADLTYTSEISIDNAAKFLSGNGTGVAKIGNQALVYSGNGYSTMMKFHSE